MLLKDKVAVIYGAGPIASAVATAFNCEGAQVFVGSRRAPALTELTGELAAKGASATTAIVDALDSDSVQAFTDSVVSRTGRLDISFCLTNPDGGRQGKALSEVSYEDFSLPIMHMTKSQFLTANAAARHMVKQGSGVIMMMTAVPARIPFPYTTGFGPAWAAVEALSRTLAAELGPLGVRTVCLHSAGTPGAARAIDESKLPTDERLAERFAGWGARASARNLLSKWPSLEDVGHMAAFFASDRAAATSAATANLTGGMVSD